MEACGLKKLITKFITKTKQNKQRFLNHFFFRSSKYVKIARLAIQENPIKIIKESKRKNQKEYHAFFS